MTAATHLLRDPCSTERCSPVQYTSLLYSGVLRCNGVTDSCALVCQLRVCFEQLECCEQDTTRNTCSTKSRLPFLKL